MKIELGENTLDKRGISETYKGGGDYVVLLNMTSKKLTVN